jgi:hypothetical protein
MDRGRSLFCCEHLAFGKGLIILDDLASFRRLTLPLKWVCFCESAVSSVRDAMVRDRFVYVIARVQIAVQMATAPIGAGSAS